MAKRTKKKKRKPGKRSWAFLRTLPLFTAVLVLNGGWAGILIP